MREADMLEIYRRSDLCRKFEERVYAALESRQIQIPTYMSAGQEYISSTLSLVVERTVGVAPDVFIQHRGHSTYINFGGSISELVHELHGDSRGCAQGRGGSASIHSYAARIYGHDGLMGSHGPISVGMCYATRHPTICFIGDAACEEDYFLAALGWAATKEIPILFVVEDNNLSILTEKAVRRSWSIVEVAEGFGLHATDTTDAPEDLWNAAAGIFTRPMLLNVNTTRKFWHAGAGIDDPDCFDRHQEVETRLGREDVLAIQTDNERLLDDEWEQ